MLPHDPRSYKRFLHETLVCALPSAQEEMPGRAEVCSEQQRNITQHQLVLEAIRGQVAARGAHSSGSNQTLGLGYRKDEDGSHVCDYASSTVNM